MNNATISSGNSITLSNLLDIISYIDLFLSANTIISKSNDWISTKTSQTLKSVVVGIPNLPIHLNVMIAQNVILIIEFKFEV